MPPGARNDLCYEFQSFSFSEAFPEVESIFSSNTKIIIHHNHLHKSAFSFLIKVIRLDDDKNIFITKVIRLS